MSLVERPVGTPTTIQRATRRTALERDACVSEIGEHSPPTLFHAGEQLRLERLPVGSRVINAPPPVPALADVPGTIAAALDGPLGQDPLDALLRPGMRLTIAFDDISVPLPPMRTPDIRGQIIEQVVERAYRAGVEDIQLIAALALHRRMTPAELRHAVGERNFAAFHPDRLHNHDADDPDGNVVIGEGPHGAPVTLNKRAAESDLLVYVHLVSAPLQGGLKSAAIGLGTYSSISAHHNPASLRHSRSFMDPPNSELHHRANAQGDIIERVVPVFHVQATTDNRMYGGPMAFLGKPTSLWSRRDQATFAAVKRATDRMPVKARRQLFQRQLAPYGVTSVTAGAAKPVHEVTLQRVAEQQAVRVVGQSDVVTSGLPYIGPYNVNSTLNPVLVMCLGLGYFFNLYQGRPLVREGGVLIFTHPVAREFHPVHHPSYIDFFEEVLAETTDPVEMQRFERAYAEDEWYSHLYRTSHAYHGVHPFYMWYWGAHALEHVGDVIFVGGDKEACRRMGFKRASTMQDALEMAEGTVGREPSITHFGCPPLLYAEVD
jgi:lactate racemase